MEGQGITINIELEGVEPSERLEAALDELCQAAAELLDDDVAGFGGGTMGDEPAMIRASWETVRPDVKSFNLGMPSTKYYDGAGNHIIGG